MGVLLQAFYWNCPALEACEGKWLSTIQPQLSGLANDGFTALWLPPSSKAAEWNSMGYDPYDYFDLGEFEQKGSRRFHQRGACQFFRGLRRRRAQPQFRSRRAGEKPHRWRDAVDPVHTRERQVSPQLDLFSSQYLRNH